MSHLSTTLKRLNRERNWGAVDIHRRKKSLLNSFLSRIIRGDQTFIDPEDLRKLADCFATAEDGTPTPEDAAAVVAAHLMDERKGPGSELIVIEIKQRGGRKVPANRISPKAERSLDFIRSVVSNDAKTESLLENLAHLLGMRHQSS